MCVLKSMYKSVVCLCVYSVQGKCIVGAEMPACPEVLRPKASRGREANPCTGDLVSVLTQGLGGWLQRILPFSY